jgi:hypothetical protein
MGWERCCGDLSKHDEA